MRKQLVLFLLPLLVSACGKNSNSQSSQINDGIKASFRNSVERNPYLLKPDVPAEDYAEFSDVDFMYCSIDPIKNITGWGVFADILRDYGKDYIRNRTYSFIYRYEQALTVLKDRTYHYVYSIGYSPNAQDFVNNFMYIAVDIYGTYDYQKLSDTNYEITLSAPLKGTETITAGHYDINGLGFFAGSNAWKHSEPDKITDFGELAELGIQESDWYVRSRTVTAEINPENKSGNKIYDDLFNANFLDDIGPYCTY